MILFALLVLLRAASVLCVQESLAVGRFFNPANAPEQPVPFSENVVWTTGDVQTIKFTTTYFNYTIALWQQNLEGGFALLGPVIFQTTTGAFPQFEWVIQTFDLDLNFSNVFFLWLHSGPSLDQGKAQPLSVTSAFFNITTAADANSNSTTTTGIINSSTTRPNTIASAPTLSALVTTTAPAATTGSPVNSSETSHQSTGLSQGAKVGVGVGVSLITVSGVIAAIVLCLKRAKEAEVQLNHSERDTRIIGDPSNIISPYKETKDKGLLELDGQEVNQSQLHTVNRYPAELS